MSRGPSRQPATPPAPWPLDGALGYSGWLYRRLTHLAASWLFGLPALTALRLFARTEVRGREHVARVRPPLLVVSNHQSLIDSHVVCLLIGLWPHGLLHEWIVPYHTPEWANFMTSRPARWLHLALRCVPVHRGAGLHQPGLERVIALLQRRRSVAYMFPEGTRSRSGEVGRATPGVGRVLVRSGCSVLPVRLWGMGEVLPVGARWPRPGRRVRVRVAPVLGPEVFSGFADNPRGWQGAAERALREVEQMAWEAS